MLLLPSAISSPIQDGSARGTMFFGQNDFVETETEDRGQALIQIICDLKNEVSDITALRIQAQDRMLGLTDEEFEVLANSSLSLREGYPDGVGIQIQTIRNTPFN